MNKRLFVGNLPYEFTEDDLRNLFAPYGEVSYAKIISDRETNRSKGFGFVELSEEEAQKAIEELNGKQVPGPNGDRAIVVNEARPMEDRNDGPRRDFGGRSGGGNDRRGGGRDRGNFRSNKSW